jgi:predicted 3-demethylubiquinone-9 3-methyltransferase (glyoxalase superfamily)
MCFNCAIKEVEMVKSLKPFLMFVDTAEQAVNQYLALFPEAVLDKVVRYGPGEPGPEGKLYRAVLRIAGQDVMIFDSYVKHEFSFTPAVSLFVECEDLAEFERLYAGLSEEGGILMEAGEYGFSTRFAWLNDRFGLSWQLNLA